MNRFFELCIALFLLIFISPFVFFVGLLILVTQGRPVFFIQERAGLDGKPFKIIKFRTMKESFDNQGNQLSDSLRLTAFGKFLRSTSIDELPELWNVVKGEMSLVGPRPLLMEYLPLYSPEQYRRHEVRPGITGWAQINGRNALSWEDKFKLDIWYVDNRSIWLDFKILYLTVKKVLIRDGIAAEGEVTMSKFTGSPK